MNKHSVCVRSDNYVHYRPINCKNDRAIARERGGGRETDSLPVVIHAHVGTDHEVESNTINRNSGSVYSFRVYRLDSV